MYSRRRWNLGNLIVIAGVVALVLTTWLIHQGARRVGRIEARAEARAERWAALLRAMPGLDLAAADAAERLLRAFYDPQQSLVQSAAIAARSIDVGDPGFGDLAVRSRIDRLDAEHVLFEDTHYLYLLGRAGPAHPHAVALAAQRAARTSEAWPLDPGPDSAWRWPTLGSAGTPERPLADELIEVYAWPRKAVGSGLTVFFAPAHGPSSFHRNLDRAYVGTSHRRVPQPGAARFVNDAVQRPGTLRGYVGHDEHHWLWPHSDRVAEQAQ